MTTLAASKRRNRACPECRGQGVILLHRDGWDESNHEQDEYDCHRCDGTGIVAVRAVAA